MELSDYPGRIVARTKERKSVGRVEEKEKKETHRLKRYGAGAERGRKVL